MSSESLDELTPTSYALLGLLALQPWTTYELAKQMQRSVHFFWPRAERKLYDEPKRLARLGLATARSEMTGRRPSTVYVITDEGREALRAWVGEPTFSPPALEMEAMVHLFFAENGTPAQLDALLHRTREDAVAAIGELCANCERFVAEQDEFPHRRALNAVNLELFVRLYETIRDWVDWAQAETATWPPVRRGRRLVAAGPPERGVELFSAIAQRSTVTPSTSRSPSP